MKVAIARWLSRRFEADDDLHTLWRARVHLLTCLVVAVALASIAINQLLHGAALVPAVVLVLTVGMVLLPLWPRDVESLDRACHALVVLSFAALVAISLHRGGLRSPVPMALALVPALAGILLGQRAMLGWLGLTLGYLLLLLALPAWLGHPLEDRVPPPPRGELFAPLLMLLTLAGLIRVMLTLQRSALDNAREAERQRMSMVRTAEMQRTEHLAMVGRLAVGVAHEVNNPLSYVVANVEYAARRIAERGDPRERETVDALRDAVDGAVRIGKIVTQLSAFGRGDAEPPRPMRLREAVETALRLSSNQLLHRARVDRELEADPVVDADAGRLTQVFLNLLINAAHAIPVGDREHNRVRVTVGLDGAGRAFTEIADTGAGIDPEVLPRVTEAFFTTKRAGEGSGLGLSISHTIVRDHGGRLSIDSTPGEGTRVRVTLPISAQECRTSHESDESIEVDDDRRILLIDDDEPVRRGIARMLPAVVVEASSAHEALALLARDPAFDAILCDVMMPDLTGVELHERLQRDQPELVERLVFVTGGAFDEPSRERLEQLGATVLTKPLLRRELLTTLEALWARSDTTPSRMQPVGAATARPAPRR